MKTRSVIAPHMNAADTLLWEHFNTRHDDKSRSALILRYQGLCAATSRRQSFGLPASVEFDDVASFGLMGLIHAIDKFKPSRGVKFETFAVHKICGAIMDAMREEDWVPRSVRDSEFRRRKAVSVWSERTGLAPSEVELARVLGMTEEALSAERQLSDRAIVCSLENPIKTVESEFGDTSLTAEVFHSADPPAFESALLAERSRVLARAVSWLPLRENETVVYYYQCDMTIKAIGVVLGISESRAWQYRKEAIVHLRGYLEADAALFT